MNLDINLSHLKNAAELLRTSKRAVALTGAGISTPSGIPDFRSPRNGLWNQVNAMEVASLTSFRYRPEKFFEWARPLTSLILNAKPNPAHIGLAQLEETNHLLAVVTQNIDDLHYRAGSKRVIEVHGHLREATCINCFQKVTAQKYIKFFVEQGITPRCDECGGILKPDIVLFGEQLPFKVVNEAHQTIATSDLLIVIGSSLEVTPVALFPLDALSAGAKLIIINEEPTYLDDRADVVFHNNAAVVVPKLVEEVLLE